MKNMNPTTNNVIGMNATARPAIWGMPSILAAKISPAGMAIPHSHRQEFSALLTFNRASAVSASCVIRSSISGM